MSEQKAHSDDNQRPTETDAPMDPRSPLEVTTSWICDRCGQLIEQADHGMVEWIDLPGNAGEVKCGESVRIVHHILQSPSDFGCQYPENLTPSRGTVADYHLQDLRGPDGLMLLLEKIAENSLPLAEVLEIIKRIHIPGYEHARGYFRTALSENVIDHNGLPGYYRQEQIRHVLDFAKDLNNP